MGSNMGQMNTERMNHSMGSAIRIHLIRVLPGFMEYVTSQIAANLNQNDSISQWKIFATLGDYDFALISVAPVESPPVLGSSWVSGVTGVREIPCFSWVKSESVEDVFDKIARHEYVTITFLQLHPAAYHNLGLSPEQDIVLKLSKRHAALGLYGIPEIVTIAKWQEIADIEDTTDFILSCCEQGNHLNHSLLYRTLTVIGVEYPLPADKRINQACVSNHKILLNVSTFERDHEKLFHSASMVFAGKSISISSTPGLFDYTITISLGSAEDFSEIIKLIIEYRNNNKNSIGATSSSVQIARPRIDKMTSGKETNLERSKPFALMRTLQININSDDCDKIEKYLGDTGRRIIRTIFNFNDILNNPVLSPNIQDMTLGITYLAKVAIDYAEIVKGNVNNQYNRRIAETALSRILLPIHAGVDQRTIAAHAAISPVESHTRYLVGGIARLLLATESLPLSLLRRAGINHWWGYCVTGVRHTHFYHDEQVVDIPPDALWRPEEWYVIIHEAMHALMHAKRQTIFDKNETVEGSFGHAFEKCKYVHINRYIIDDAILNESVVDALAFECGPNWDRQLYFVSVWNYILRHKATAGTMEDPNIFFVNFFVRNTFVWVYSEIRLNLLTVEQFIDNPWETFDRMVENYTAWDLKKSVIDEAKRLGLISGMTQLSKLAPLIEFMNSTKIFDKNNDKERQEYFDEKLKNILLKAVSGSYDFDKGIKYPELLVWKLRELANKRSDSEIKEGLNKIGNWARFRVAAIHILANEYWRKKRTILGMAEYVGDKAP